MEETERTLELPKQQLVEAIPFPEVKNITKVSSKSSKMMDGVVRLERLDLRKANIRWLFPVIRMEKIKVDN